MTETHQSAWQRRFNDYVERIAQNHPGRVEEFVLDFTEFAHEEWGYAPDIALSIARRSANERDTYFKLYLIGQARMLRTIREDAKVGKT
jgi:hypothetical protein